MCIYRNVIAIPSTCSLSIVEDSLKKSENIFISKTSFFPNFCITNHAKVCLLITAGPSLQRKALTFPSSHCLNDEYELYANP